MDLLSAAIWAYGGDFLNKDNTKAMINSPKSVEALTFWSDLYAKYHPDLCKLGLEVPIGVSERIGVDVGT